MLGASTIDPLVPGSARALKTGTSPQLNDSAAVWPWTSAQHRRPGRLAPFGRCVTEKGEAGQENAVGFANPARKLRSPHGILPFDGPRGTIGCQVARVAHLCRNPSRGSRMRGGATLGAPRWGSVGAGKTNKIRT